MEPTSSSAVRGEKRADKVVHLQSHHIVGQLCERCEGNTHGQITPNLSSAPLCKLRTKSPFNVMNDYGPALLRHASAFLIALLLLFSLLGSCLGGALHRLALAVGLDVLQKEKHEIDRM